MLFNTEIAETAKANYLLCVLRGLCVGFVLSELCCLGGQNGAAQAEGAETHSTQRSQRPHL